MPNATFRRGIVFASLLGLPSLLLPGCGDDSPPSEPSGGTGPSGGSAQAGHGGALGGHANGGQGMGQGGTTGGGGTAGGGGAPGHTGGESTGQGGSEATGGDGEGGLSAGAGGAENTGGAAGAENTGGAAGAENTGGTAGAENTGGIAGGSSGGEGGGGGDGGAPDGQENVQWLGKCTPVALSDDAQTVLALEGVWKPTSGWTALPDLPGGEVSNTPRTLSGDGRIVYGASGSALGNEIYRLDVESGAIQGLGIEYNAYLGDEPGDVPETVRSIDTNGDGSVLSGIASFQTASTLNMIYFRWTPSAGFVDMAPSGPWPDREPASVALSSHAETTIFGSGELPIIISTTPPSLASNQFGGIVLFPVSVSGDGTWYSIGGTHGTPGTVPSNCLRSFGGCWAANQPILDLNYDGHAGVGREYYGSSGLRYPVGSFYWTSTENVRYLHEALYDHGILLDVDILSRAAINADGRSVLGTATRRFSDGSSRNECFIAHFPDPVPPAPADEIVTGTAPDQALSAGGDTTCATGSDGSARCWGAGIAAMLGRAARDAWSALPTAPLQDAAQLALAPSHSCALLSDHSVQCWGNNGAGQLGDGTLLSSDVPVGVLGIDDAVQVAVAGGVSCAVREAFGLQCWGQSNGAPSSLPSARAVSLAGGGGCATLNDGTVTCWGAAEAFATDASEGPWPIPGLQNISQFEMAGYSSWCALSSNGVVTCSWPECCDQSTCPPEDPVALGGTVRAFSRPVTQISAGDTHFCALLDNGTVECAGYGGSGQLGARNRLFCAPTPVPVAGVTGVVQIAAGAHHTCALLDSGAVRCWGRDDVGQLGLGFVYTSHLASPPVFPLPNLSLFGSELPPGLSRPAYVRRAR